MRDYLTLTTRMTELIAHFEPYSEGDDIEGHFERMELFFEVHKIASEKKWHIL